MAGLPPSEDRLLMTENPNYLAVNDHPRRSMTDTPVIAVQDLKRRYGDFEAVRGVSFSIDTGEVFGFLGPNGAGKTTTIRTVLNLIRPTSGKPFVFGIEASADPVAIHKRIGYIPGEFTLYDRLTGGQTLDYFANLRGGVDKAYQKELIERFDIDPSRRYKEYSKGNKQKIGLVIALQHRPDLLLLDEPTSGLDPLIQQEFYGVIRDAKAEGRTVFLSSHILSEVEKTCDRVAIIREGVLARVDRTRRVANAKGTAPPTATTEATPLGTRGAITPSPAPAARSIASSPPTRISRCDRVATRTKRARMRRARTTDQAIAELAHELGFTDQAHFTRAFRRRFGLPPGRFRKSAPV